MPSELAGRFAAAVERLVAPGRDVALLDFPNHPNVGDSAIWLGELAQLAAAGNRIAFACDHHAYSAPALRRRLGPDGVILLHGGGNFGDVWPWHQRLREQVVRDFPDREIVQLPQTLHFADEAGLERARAVFGAHERFSMLCRDERSLALARDRLGVPAGLSPDAAFALGALPREPAEVDVLVLRRGDAEATGGWWDGAAAPDMTVREVDWLEASLRGSRRSVPYRAAQRLSQPLGRRWAAWGGPAPSAAGELLGRTYELMARFLVDHGRRMLCQGRVVVTDRLHGHILCLLLGIPHVIVDNAYGKLRGFHGAWTAAAPGVRFASAGVEAPALARGLLECDRTSTAAG